MHNNTPAHPPSKLSHPLEVGSVSIRNRVFLAPMSGVSDLPFRARAHDHGAGLVVTEMIASEEYCKARPESRKRAVADGRATRMLQLAGREPRWMAEAAKIARDDGAEIIDINMGCPAKKVTGGYSGSALMRDLDHAMTLVEATVGAVDIPVTLKMRLGWDRETINAPELARRAENAGIAMVTVHGRTRSQFYNGEADWRAIANVRQAISVPLVVNGDIGSLDDAEMAVELSGADAVMIGRAAYGQPWLPGAIACRAGYAGPAAPAPGRRHLPEYIIAHYEGMLGHYGLDTGRRHARKHLGWYIDRHGSALGLHEGDRRKIMTATDHRDVIATLSKTECSAVAEAA